MFYIPSFSDIFYIEIDLFLSSVVRQAIISLSRFSMTLKGAQLQAINFHSNNFISKTMFKRFVLVPLDYFFNHIDSLDFEPILFNMPFEIFEIHAFDNGTIGIVELDKSTLNQIMGKKLALQKNYKNVPNAKIELKEDRRVKLNQKWIQKMIDKVTRKNESKLHLFGFKFNQKTLNIEKFMYKFDIDLSGCFPFQKEAMLNYLRDQTYYLDSITPMSVGHLNLITLGKGYKNQAYVDPHKEHENNWKQQLKEKFLMFKFYSTTQDFYCLFQHRYHVQDSRREKFEELLKGKANKK